MPALTSLAVNLEQGYGSLATNPTTGISATTSTARYLELQFQANLPANVATRVFTLRIPTQLGRARRLQPNLHTTVCTFGTVGTQTRYQTSRINITTAGALTATGLGRISQTETGMPPVVTYDLNAELINGAWYLRLNLTCTLAAVVSGELYLDGVQ